MYAETDLSAKKTTSGARARFPCADANLGWTCRAGAAQNQGKKTSVGIKPGARNNNLVMLPKENRLTKSKDVERAVKAGRSFGTPLLGVRALATGSAASRFAVVAGLAAHKRATRRNRAKRLVREALRLNLPRIRPGYDAVVIIRAGGIDKTYPEIENALGFAFQKLGLVR